MPLNTILSPTRISPVVDGIPTDTDDFPTITTLSNGSFVVAYHPVNYTSDAIPAVSQVFNGQGQLIQETFATTEHFGAFDADLAGLSGGGFAMVWTQLVLTPAGTGAFQVFTAVYDNAGHQVSTPVAIDANPAADSAQVPQVAALAGGGYVVTYSILDGGGTDVVVAVYNSAGQQVVAPIDVTNSPGVVDATDLSFFVTSTAALANGGFAVTWTTTNSDVDNDVYTAIYNAQGQQVLAPLNVTHSTDIAESHPQVAALSNGNYALTWDGTTDPAGFAVQLTYTAVFDAQGNQIAAPSVVGPGQVSRIAALTNGDYAVSWSDTLSLFTAVYDGQGEQLVAPVTVSSTLTGAFNFPAGSITALASGAYALTWQAQIADGSFDIFTAVYDSQGQQLVAPVNVSNSPGVDDQLEIVDARGSANGSYAITWQGPGSLLPAEYIAIYQFVPSGTPGDVSVIGSPDINIDLSALVDVGGNVTISDNHFAVSIDLHNLASVGGNFVLTNNGALLTITLPSLETVTGSVDISNNSGATTIGLGSLSTVSGSVTIDNNSATGSVDVGSLTSAGSVDISDNDSATTIGLGSLSTVAGSVTIDNNSAAGSVDVGSLTSAGSVDISDNDSATTIGLGSVTTVSGSANISGNTSVITIDLGSLVQAGAIVIADNGVITLDLAALVNVGGTVSLTNNDRLLSIDMPDLTTVGGDLVVSGNKSATALSIGHLATVGGDLIVDGNTAVTVINAAGLTTVSGDLSITNNDSVGMLDLEALLNVGGNLDISGNTDATVINASSLTTVSGDLSITDNTSAGELDLESLLSVDGNVDISGNTAATVINASSLTTVDGNVDINSNDSTTVVDASSLVTVSGDCDINLAPDATVDASALGPGGGTVHVIGDTLTTDVILGSLANLGGTLTITTADGVTLTSGAGLGTITLTGTAGDNTLIGSLTARNVIAAGGGNDSATGGDADDAFTGGGGNDALDGKGGTDTAVYSGARGDYRIVQNADGSLTVSDQRAGALDGTDTLRSIELFQFSDGLFTLADVLPPAVITSNGGGDSAQVSVAENTTAVTQVTATNPNAAQSLAFSLAGGADEDSFHIDPVTGELFFIAPHNFEQPNDAGQNGVYDVVVRVSDGLHSDTQALAITVTNVNEAPVLANQTANQSATVGAAFALTLPANTFQDVDNGDHLTLAATLSNGAALPTWLTFNPVTGAFSGTPAASDVGGFDIKVTATDTGGLSAAADIFHVAVAAANANHAPVITSDLGGATASVIITDDTRYVATVHATDPDPNTKITYSIVGGADQKLFAIDPKTGVLMFKATPQDGHSYNVTVASSDGSLQDTQAIKVQVANGPFEFGNTSVADTFEFRTHFGLAIVSNFDATSASHDVLELDHALFRNANPNSSPGAIFDLIKDHSFQVGRDVVIVTDTFDIIDLRNTNLHNLTASDFLLV